jgi:hypothetical protein
MSEAKPNMVGRLGLVIYWLGCIAAAVCVVGGAYVLVVHDPSPTRVCIPPPCKPKPYPWGDAGLALGAGAVAWVAGRGVRYILKGD